VTAILSVNAGRSRDGWLLLVSSPQLSPANWTLVLGHTLLRPVEEVRHHLFGELKADAAQRVSGL
jgi:hypothetical protein